MLRKEHGRADLRRAAAAKTARCDQMLVFCAKDPVAPGALKVGTKARLWLLAPWRSLPERGGSHR